MHRSVLLVLLSSFVAGCLTSTVQRVETLGKGDTQVSLEPSLHMGPTSYEPARNQSFYWGAPGLNMTLRHGVTDRLDLGVRLGNVGYEVHSKYMIRSPEEGPVALSVAPYGSVYVISNAEASLDADGVTSAQESSSRYTSLKVPLLIGIQAGDDQLVIGPNIKLVHNASRVYSEILGSYLKAGPSLEAGVSLGFNKAFPDSSFSIHPELAVSRPVFGSTYSLDSFRAAATIGLQFGR